MKLPFYALLIAFAPLLAEDQPKPEKTAAEQESVVTTRHTATIGAAKVPYKATAGFIILNKGDSKEKSAAAKIFYTAYTREAADTNKRPVIFSFNGGPGAASVWLHLGALGPRRVQMGPEGNAPAPPYQLVDNDLSWLDLADLVFIDPVSTGYSRPVADDKAGEFHGFKNDIKSVAEFIRIYTTREMRWLSPKYLVGESYGTTRAAALSDYLQQNDKLYLNGIILVSSILNFQTIDFSAGNDLPATLFLPSYAAAAWYHKKLGADLQSQPLEQVRLMAEEFAMGDYAQALMRGDTLTLERRKQVAQRLSELTSLPAQQLLQQNLRIPPNRFFGDLLREEGLAVGRFDARITGLRYEPGTEGAEYDPSFEAVKGVFTSAINDYLRRELKFESNIPYEVLADVQPWSFDSENQYLNVAQSLREAMIRNTYLKVWVASGYYDLATPYFATDHTLRTMQLDPRLRKNIRTTYYEAGHMMFTHTDALRKLKADFAAYLQGSTD